MKETIDWEQRRYEIARDLFAAKYGRPNAALPSASACVMLADSLINELQK